MSEIRPSEEGAEGAGNRGETPESYKECPAGDEKHETKSTTGYPRERQVEAAGLEEDKEKQPNRDRRQHRDTGQETVELDIKDRNRPGDKETYDSDEKEDRPGGKDTGQETRKEESDQIKEKDTQDSGKEGDQPRDTGETDPDEDWPQTQFPPKEHRLFDPDEDQSRDTMDSDEHLGQTQDRDTVRQETLGSVANEDWLP